jgi:uncharacterized membrane protein
MAYLIVLRLIHIFAGVFWAGTTFFIVSSLGPTARASGPEGGQFMLRLTGRVGRMTLFMGLAATLSALSGILLYERVSGGFAAGWITSGPGLALTVGGVAGIVGWIVGYLVIARSSMRLTALATEIQAGRGPPSPEQAAEMQALREKQSQGGIWVAILLVVAVTGMAVAQYIWL